jgi:hypothetical protein
MENALDGTAADGATQAINGIAVIVSLATLVSIAISTARLYGKAHVPGSGNMIGALVGALLGIPAFAAYVAMTGLQAAAQAEYLFNLYEVSCVAFGAFGYWRLSKAIVARRGEER